MTKRNILAVTALVAIAVSLSACGNHDQVAQAQPQYQQQPQQQVVQQPQVIEQPAPQQVIVQQQPQVVYAQQPQVIVQHDNGAANLMAGMAIGSMMSGGGRDVHHYHYAPAPVRQTTIVHKTYIQAAPAAPVVAAAPVRQATYASRSTATTSGLRRR